MNASLRRFAALSLAGIGLGVMAPAPASAQAPKVFFACYVPSSGTVYRIKEPDTPAACGTSTKKGVAVAHVEFSWTDGAGAVSSDHGALAGLADDDHPQYLLGEGVRTGTNGFAVSGAIGAGSLPTLAAGTAFAWYPSKGAFRAVDRAYPIMPEDVGLHSIAMGNDASAPGDGGIALGWQTRAGGVNAVALSGGAASGDASFAVGAASAQAVRSVAIGFHAVSNGAFSWAIGANAHTNGKGGSFVFGDATTIGPGTSVLAAQDNQFVVRAQRFWLGTNNNVTATAGRLIETSTGAYLSSGGAWTNSSDSAKKAGFRDVDGDQLLAKLIALPIRTWSYKTEDASVRHIGPTAQDFRAAFAMGDGDKAIATVDADGVSLAAIQALVKRVIQLETQLAQLLAASPDAGARR